MAQLRKLVVTLFALGLGLGIAESYASCPCEVSGEVAGVPAGSSVELLDSDGNSVSTLLQATDAAGLYRIELANVTLDDLFNEPFFLRVLDADGNVQHEEFIYGEDVIEDYSVVDDTIKFYPIGAEE